MSVETNGPPHELSLEGAHFRYAVSAPGDLVLPTSPPITEVVLKVAEGCNIACDYCYMYTGPDQSWRDRPAFMSDEIIDAVATNMDMSAGPLRITDYTLLLHGGEPLMRNASFFRRVGDIVRERITRANVQIGIQTNATLITNAHLQAFDEYGIRIGVSIDANNEAGNAHRLFRNGRSSLGLARAGIERIMSNEQYRHLLGGALAVIDVRNDPLQVYKELKELGFEKIDFLFPLGNWEYRPPFREGNDPYRLDEQVPTPYADWLITIFDQWVADQLEAAKNPQLPPPPEVRYFKAVMSGFAGRRYGQEVVGGIRDVGSLFVDTDGEIGLVDAYKTTAAGMTDLGVKITGPGRSYNYLMAAHAKASRKIRALGAVGLPALCQGCDVATVCGGGYHPTRFLNRPYWSVDRPAPSYPDPNLPYWQKDTPPYPDRAYGQAGWPSVYHPDLYAFMTHVRAFMFENK
jgi:uncharacterized protein